MRQNRWIAHENVKDGNKINLLCFIFDGGSASYFAPWKYKINPDINLIPILYPAREKRRSDPMYENMKEFIKDLVESAGDIFKGRYAFFGYCSGAILAYEASVLAREMYGNEPEYGMIISTDAPGFLREKVPVITKENEDALFFNHMNGLPFLDKKVLNDKAFLDYYRPLFKADYTLLSTYEYKEREKLACDFDILMCPEDDQVKRENVEQWKDLTSGKVSFYDRDGGHFLVEANAEFIFDVLNKRLSEADLPAEDIEVSEQAINSAYESTKEEKKIIDIWKSIFGEGEFTHSDNFFLKGGDSLKAIKIVNGIKNEFGVTISINDVFNYPDIRELSEFVVKQAAENENNREAEEGEI